MVELWWILALISGMITGINIYLNQIIKMPSSLMMVYRGLLAALLMIPFAPLFPLPQNIRFWVLVTIQGLLISYSDRKMYSGSKKFGGEIVASIKPLVVSLVFVFWWVIKPSQLVELLQNPERFILIIFCILAISFSLFIVKNNKTNYDALIFFIPALFCSMIIEANNKNITMLGATTSLSSSVFYYCMLTAFWSGVPNFIRFLKYNNWHLIFYKKYLIGGCIIICSVQLGNILKNVAMYYTSNPAYVTAVMSLYPVWIIVWNLFYYRLNNIEKYPHCNFFAITILLIATISLILLQ